jgi:hypothetical protein
MNSATDPVSRVGTRCKPSSDNGSRIALATCWDGQRPVDGRGLVQTQGFRVRARPVGMKRRMEPGANTMGSSMLYTQVVPKSQRYPFIFGGF